MALFLAYGIIFFYSWRTKLHTGSGVINIPPCPGGLDGLKTCLCGLQCTVERTLLAATLLSAVTMAPFSGLSWSANADL